MDVTDTKIGSHRHIDLVQVLHAAADHLAAQLDEVGAARWATRAEMSALDTSAELPALVADAAQWPRPAGQSTHNSDNR